MRKYIMIILLGLLLVIAGCNQKKRGGGVETPGSPFIGGDKGIVAEFLPFGVLNENDNIEEIFQDELFNLEAVLKNKGEAEIPAQKAKIILSGVELTSFTPNIPQMVFNSQILEAVSEFNKQGGEETINFAPSGQQFRYAGTLIGNNIDLSFFAKIEYLYKTMASVPKVCFKGDLNDEGLCEVEETKTVYSSAGPIQVKSAVEKSAGSGLISVELELQNVGSGKVTLPEDNAAFDHRFDQLRFIVTSPSDNRWDCKAGGNTQIARLDSSGKATIVCRLKADKKLAKADLYTQELGLSLDYKYRDIIHKQLRIKKQIPVR